MSYLTQEAYSPFSTHQLLILLPGTKNGFVKPNVNFTGDPDIDRGLMARFVSGSPITMSGDLVIEIAKDTDPVVGLLVYEGPGTSPLDGMGGGDQSHVLTYVYGLATVQVPTRVLESGVTFAVNDSVYASPNGKLTNVKPASGPATKIGTAISVEGQSTDALILQMSI